MSKPVFMERIEREVKEAEEQVKKLQEQGQNNEETPPEEEKPVVQQNVFTEEEPNEEPVAGQEPKPQEDWEHKYRVLQGKYNAEVPRLHEENKALKKEIDFLKGKVELLQKLVTEQSQPSSPPAQSPQVGTEDEDIKTLKEDFPEIYRAIVKLLENYAPKSMVEATQSRIEQAQREMAEKEKFIVRLTELVPDWAVLNTDPEFLEWLKETVPYVNKTKHQIMLEAAERGDADTVASFFNEFKKSKAPSNGSSSNKLNEMVAPPRSKSTSATGSRAQQVYSLSRLRQAYKDVALGKMSKEELQKLEKEFVRAMKEGRISD